MLSDIQPLSAVRHTASQCCQTYSLSVLSDIQPLSAVRHTASQCCQTYSLSVLSDIQPLSAVRHPYAPAAQSVQPVLSRLPPGEESYVDCGQTEPVPSRSCSQGDNGAVVKGTTSQSCSQGDNDAVAKGTASQSCSQGDRRSLSHHKAVAELCHRAGFKAGGQSHSVFHLLAATVQSRQAVLPTPVLYFPCGMLYKFEAAGGWWWT